MLLLQATLKFLPSCLEYQMCSLTAVSPISMVSLLKFNVTRYIYESVKHGHFKSLMNICNKLTVSSNKGHAMFASNCKSKD